MNSKTINRLCLYFFVVIYIYWFLDIYLTPSEPPFYTLPLSKSRIWKNPNEKLVKIVCSKFQNLCFYIIDQTNGAERKRLLRPETLANAALTVIKLDANNGEISPELNTAYSRAMIQAGFDTGTFAGMEDFKKAEILQIGLGGGAIQNFLSVKFPATHLTTVELDPTMKYIAENWFMTNQTINHPCNQIIVDDGAHFLKTTSQKYDLILLDACHNEYQGIVCPHSVFQKESVIEKISEVLTENGTFSLNYLRVFNNFNTTDKVFKAKYEPFFHTCFTVLASGNMIVICTNKKIPKMTSPILKNQRQNLLNQNFGIFAENFEIID